MSKRKMVKRKVHHFVISPGTPVGVHHTKRGTITVPAWRASATCADCNARMWNEWCHLRRPIWEKVWPGTHMKSAYAPPAMKHFLCIGCIEERLGRRLTRRDFDLRRLINQLGGRLKFEVRSRRFQARLRQT
jgi:hypothetical protein